MSFSKYIPTWLFRPYVAKDQNIHDILIPLLMHAGFAFAGAIPFFEVKGVIVGSIYMLGSFLLLCLVRYFVFCMLARPRGEDGYVSPSVLYMADMWAITFPALIWGTVSLKIIAYYCLGWQPV